MSFVVQYLVALIGLGVAIDYSLLIVTRWREERAHGRRQRRRRTHRDGDRRAQSVIFCGDHGRGVVGRVGRVPLPFLRSIGLGGLLIPLLSVAVSPALVPVLLSSVGPRPARGRAARPAPTAARAGPRIATAVVRHRWVAIVGASAVLLALAAPRPGLSLGSPPSRDSRRTRAPGRARSHARRPGSPAGVFRPDRGAGAGGPGPGRRRRLNAIDGVPAVEPRRGAGWQHDGARPGAGVDRRRSGQRRPVAASLDAVRASPLQTASSCRSAAPSPRTPTSCQRSTATPPGRPRRRHGDVPAAGPGAAVAVVAGQGAGAQRHVDRRRVRPDRADLAGRRGVPSCCSANEATGAITVWVPVAVFAFLFGLSMDYEVFILSRMREAYDEHG